MGLVRIQRAILAPNPVAAREFSCKGSVSSRCSRSREPTMPSEPSHTRVRSKSLFDLPTTAQSAPIPRPTVVVYGRVPCPAPICKTNHSRHATRSTSPCPNRRTMFALSSVPRGILAPSRCRRVKFEILASLTQPPWQSKNRQIIRSRESIQHLAIFCSRSQSPGPLHFWSQRQNSRKANRFQS
jgi:hypothetical protein